MRPMHVLTGPCAMQFVFIGLFVAIQAIVHIVHREREEDGLPVTHHRPDR